MTDMIDQLIIEAAKTPEQLQHEQKREKLLPTMKRAAQTGIGTCMVIIFAALIGLLMSWPQVALAQASAIAPGELLDFSVELANKLPPDFARLCLTAIIFMTGVLLIIVTVFLGIIEAMRKSSDRRTEENTKVLLALAGKPCLIRSEDGLAIIEQAHTAVARRVIERFTKEIEDRMKASREAPKAAPKPAVKGGRRGRK